MRVGASPVGRAGRGEMPPGLIVYLPSKGLSLKLDGVWSNGWESWSIVSPGPWNRASFTVKPDDDLKELAWLTAQRFLPPLSVPSGGWDRPPRHAPAATLAEPHADPVGHRKSLRVGEG